MIHSNVHLTSTSNHALVRDDDGVYTESGMRIAPAEVRARKVAEQASRWLAFATERTRMKPHTLAAKALTSVAFSVHHGAASLAIPSKLAGTSKRQRALWALVRDPAEPWAALAVEPMAEGLVASCEGEPLGLVQSKHLGWVRPLVTFGLTVHLSKVTGSNYDGYTLGANVAFGHVGTALDLLLNALGRSGDGGSETAGGDGAPSSPVPVAEVSSTRVVSSGDGAEQMANQVASGPSNVTPSPSPLRLIVRPVPDAVRLGADPDDVVLMRRVDGTATATVSHAVRHSPGGIEWGYGGAGPADLARSVLLALACEATAERLYEAFKADVIARVPRAGGVLRAADVRAWVAAQTGLS